MKKIIALVLFGFAQLAMANPNAPEIRVVSSLPNKIGNFIKYKNIHQYQSPLGVAQRYQYRRDDRNYAWMSIYVYDFDRGPIADGLQANITKAAYKKAVGDLKTMQARGIYRNLRILSRRIIKPAGHEVYVLAFRYEQKRKSGLYEDYDSILAITGIRQHLFKVRITATPELVKNKEVDAMIKQMVEALKQGGGDLI